MLGIIGAMDEEVIKLKEVMEDVEITRKASMLVIVILIHSM